MYRENPEETDDRQYYDYHLDRNGSSLESELKQQTAVDWLLDQLLKDGYIERLPVLQFQQAKEMEKQQIIDAVKYGYNGHKIGHYTPNFREQQELFEQYYKKTYGE